MSIGIGGYDRASHPFIEDLVETVANETEKSKLGGIKVSLELVRVDFMVTEPSQNIPEICDLLTKHRINMPFLTVDNQRDKGFLSCCVTEEDAVKLERILETRPEFEIGVQYHRRAGLLSIFPTRANLNLLGLCLESFGKIDLKLHGMSSSISALTFVIDFNRLDDAVEALQQVFELPSYHTPFKPEIRFTQSPVVKKD